jgi:biopolymer transport protein ExbD
MAEIQIRQGKGNRTATTPRIDLTPMVDLGFLLITFFMMTTTMARPKEMDIQMPFTPSESTTAFYESSAITLMPAKDHRIFYYEGRYLPDMKLKEAGTDAALRLLLQQKQKMLLQREKPEERELQVLIKADATATTDDIIGLFDEMVILGVKFYAMVDIYPEEAALVAKALQ